MRTTSSHKHSAAQAKDDGENIVEKATASARKIEESLQDIAQEAGRKAKNLMDSADKEISEATGKIEENLQEIAFEAGRKAQKLMDSADKEISSVTKSVTAHIRKKPIQSGAIALGVGLLLGYLFRGSNSSSDRKNVDHQ